LTDCKFIANTSIVNRYVESLYHVALAGGIEKEVAKQLLTIRKYVSCVENSGKFLKKISLLPGEGTKFVDFLVANLELSAEVCNFLNLLRHRRKLEILTSVADVYVAYLEKLSGKKVVFLTLANDVVDSVVKKISDNVTEILGKNIEFTVKKDQSLIDGIKIQYGSKVLDYSVKSSLGRLLSAARRENYGN
jgi:ATP synthase F1 delta subunit